MCWNDPVEVPASLLFMTYEVRPALMNHFEKDPILQEPKHVQNVR